MFVILDKLGWHPVVRHARLAHPALALLFIGGWGCAALRKLAGNEEFFWGASRGAERGKVGIVGGGERAVVQMGSREWGAGSDGSWRLKVGE